ncbi:ABC transporter permease [Oceanibacterium hippocampi]|uniref:FtsX-like permease family protein n=1 Tax=Oceanibacterium hippocampi TaxID=745714 RepID=A0A1Y5RDF8_9PROT|nr:FtsX-like permease family protein [Oceanibacterium hippocampi]SLN12162.1 FtsX-like permease family protein [Oceanibacterium hippocampi]
MTNHGAGGGAGLALAIRFARRDLRGTLRHFRVFLACLALGVTAIAGVGSFSTAIVAGMARDGQAILGGDVSLRLTHREATAEQLDWLAERGRVSESVTMRAMAGSETGTRTLVELKAVDSVYPLYGQLSLTPAQDTDAAFAMGDGAPGAVVESLLLDRLGVRVGDRLAIGEESFEIRGTIAAEPDKAGEGLGLGPRVLVSRDSLAATGLVQTGSMIRYHYRLALPSGVAISSFVSALKAQFPDAGWRIRDRSNGAPGLKGFIDRLGVFLTLVGLSALIVGGVGVGNAVKSYMDGKIATIAMLKCLGAPGALIFRIYLVQILALGALGTAIGLVLGGLVPVLLARAVADLLPVPIVAGFYPKPLLLAAAYGGLTAFIFAVWPLALAREVPAAGLFRSIVSPSRGLPRPGYLLMMAASLAVVVALAIGFSDDRRLAIWFVAGTAASFAAFLLIARGIVWLARHAPTPRSAAIRLAIANLHRPGAQTGSIVLSLGLGLSLLVAVALIEGNLSRQVSERLPEEAPAFFFIDIQPDQIADVETVARAVSGVEDFQSVPSLRGRLVRIKGQSTAEMTVDPDAAWVLRGDRGLTYAETPPENSQLVAGQWWPADYQGPPLVSMDEEIAAALGLEIGDTVTVNVLGRELTAEIANLRRIEWTTLGINFVMVFNPSALRAAPHSFIATAQAHGEAEAALFREITNRFPNVTVIRMKEALGMVNDLLDNIAAAVRATAAVTLLAGALVLAGAMAAGYRRRVYESVILKVLGAERRQIMRTYLTEYALLGLATAVVAGAIGWAAAYGVVTELMGAEWFALPWTLVGTALIGLAVTVLLGLAGTWRVLAVRPAPMLRNA